jgi:hypothetical protein
MKRAYENYLAGAQLTPVPIDRLRSRRGANCGPIKWLFP